MHEIVMWLVISSSGMCGNYPMEARTTAFDSREKAIKAAVNDMIICGTESYVKKGIVKEIGEIIFPSYKEIRTGEKEYKELISGEAKP